MVWETGVLHNPLFAFGYTHRPIRSWYMNFSQGMAEIRVSFLCYVPPVADNSCWCWSRTMLSISCPVIYCNHTKAHAACLQPLLHVRLYLLTFIHRRMSLYLCVTVLSLIKYCDSVFTVPSRQVIQLLHFHFFPAAPALQMRQSSFVRRMPEALLPLIRGACSFSELGLFCVQPGKGPPSQDKPLSLNDAVS